MSLPDTYIMWSAVPAEVREQLVCPSWCVVADEHPQSDAEILRQGGLNFLHMADEVVAVESPALAAGRRPVTVRLVHFVGVDRDGVVEDEGPSVIVDGLSTDTGLTVAEADQLARAIQSVTESLAVTR